MKKRLYSEFEQGLGFSFFPMGAMGNIPSSSKETKKRTSKREKSANAETPQEGDDYSSLGERLMTLARSLAPKHRDYTPIAKKLAELEYDSSTECFEDVLHRMAKVLRPLLRSLGKEVQDSSVVKELKALTPHINWNLCTYEELFSEKNLETGMCPESYYLGRYATLENGVPPRHLSKNRKIDPEERTLYMYCPQVFPQMLLMGMQLGTSKYKNAWLKSSTHLKVVDMAYAIAYLIMLDTVWSNLMSEDLQKTILYKQIVACAGESFLSSSVNYSSRTLENCYEKGNIHIPSKLSGTIFFMVPHYSEEDVITKTASEYLRENGCEVYVIGIMDHFDLTEHSVLSKLSEILPSSEIQKLKIRRASSKYSGDDFEDDLKELLRKLPLTGEIPCFMSEEMLVRYLVWDSQHGDFSQSDCDLLMELIISYYNRIDSSAALPGFYNSGNYYSPIGLIIKLFLTTVKVMEKEVRYMERESEDKKAHAKSFEDKKHVPKKILEIMENSVLNERFGFVEYDEMCDTEKIQTVNAQLLHFVDTYFPKEDLKEVSLRFRRLGNHKAYGLYFSFCKCIAVELTHPSSFVHEFGHMLDFTHGMVSNRLNSKEFDAVYKSYVTLLDKKLGNHPEMLKKYKSGGKKSKYNYYTEETEVFARSFEVYITDALGLENTIIKDFEQYQENPYVYHMDNEEYMECVRGFFSSLPFMQDVVNAVKENSNNNEKAGVA